MMKQTKSEWELELQDFSVVGTCQKMGDYKKYRIFIFSLLLSFFSFFSLSINMLNLIIAAVQVNVHCRFFILFYFS